MEQYEAWMDSCPKKINWVIRKIIRWDVKLKNPELVLEFYTNIQWKLDDRNIPPPQDLL